MLATQNVNVDDINSIYTDTAGSTGFYFARFKNTITSVFSAYTGAVPVGGYSILSARSIINSALGMINKLPSNLLTDTYSFNEINNGQMEVLREMKRWSFMQIFDYNLGQILTGQWKIALPANIDDTFSDKSVYNFRVGTSDNLTRIDKAKWNEITEGVAHTTLTNIINIGDATVTLVNSSDFPSGGTLQIGSHTYQYTAINQTTGVATLSAISTTTDAAGSDVFSGATLGTPAYWTTWGGNIQFYPVLSTTLNQQDGHLDYYRFQ